MKSCALKGEKLEVALQPHGPGCQEVRWVTIIVSMMLVTLHCLFGIPCHFLHLRAPAPRTAVVERIEHIEGAVKVRKDEHD